MTQNNIIETISAYRTADGRRWLDLEEARKHVTEKRLLALRDSMIKNNPELFNVSVEQFLAIINYCAGSAAKILSDPLIPGGTASPTPSPAPAAPRPIPVRPVANPAPAPTDIPGTRDLRERIRADQILEEEIVSGMMARA